MNILNKLELGRIKLEDYANIKESKVVKQELIEMPFAFNDRSYTHIIIFMLRKSFSKFTTGCCFMDSFGNMGIEEVHVKENEPMKKAQKSYEQFKSSSLEMIEQMLKNQ